MWDTEPSQKNPSGIRIDPDTALRSTVVLACARVLAETIGGLPLHLYKRDALGGKTIAREQPLYNVLHHTPNSWQTSFEWREQAMLHLCLHGNAYSELRAGLSGAVSELIPLHPSRMKVERIETGRLRYVYTEPNGEKTLYTQDQIMHIRWLSNDGVTGMVPVELARDAIGLARACEIHGASYFGNGARPGIVLETDNMIPPEAATALRDNWERTHRGADRASKTAVLMGGLKAHELGGNNQESQFLESRRFQVEEICRLYRVPPHLVGDLTRSSFSNIEQQSIDFVQHTLLPWLRRFETAFARDLIADNTTYFAEFDTRGLLRGDASARASYYQTLWNLGVASVNEIRSWENLNPVENGDTRFVQLNMQTLEQATKPPAPPAGAPGLPGAAPLAAPPATQPQTGAAPTGPKLAPPAGRALWQEFSQELVSDGREARSLTISVDFDQTFAADPDLWGSFALDAAEAGNTVVMITRREDTPENQAEVTETIGGYADAFSTVMLIGPETLKDDAAQKAGIAVDIWIDDSPQTVRAETKQSEHRFNEDQPRDADGKFGSGGGATASAYQKGTRKGIKQGQQVKIQKKGSGKVHEGVVQTVTHDGSKTTVVYKDKYGKTNTITIANAASVELKAAAAFNKTGDAAALAKATGAQLAKPEPKQTAPKKKEGGVAKDANGIPIDVQDGKPDGWGETSASFSRTPLQDAIAKTPTAKSAIEAYTGSQHASLNAALREGKGPGQNFSGKSLKDAVKDAKSKWDVALVAALDIATQAEKGSQVRTLYRGVASRDLARQMSFLKPGDTFTDSGFGSASLAYHTASNFGGGDGCVVYKIRTKQGLPISDMSQHSHEREVLLPRNMQYKMVKHEWRKTSAGSRMLHVEVEEIGISNTSNW
jgi:HK97 family phage portal protein